MVWLVFRPEVVSIKADESVETYLDNFIVSKLRLFTALLLLLNTTLKYLKIYVIQDICKPS